MLGQDVMGLMLGQDARAGSRGRVSWRGCRGRMRGEDAETVCRARGAGIEFLIGLSRAVPLVLPAGAVRREAAGGAQDADPHPRGGRNSRDSRPVPVLPPSSARLGAARAALPASASGMKESSLPGTSLQRACRLLVAFCALHLSATLLYYLAGSALGPPGSPEPPPRRPPPANLSLPFSRPPLPPAGRPRPPFAGSSSSLCPEPSPLLGECRPVGVWVVVLGFF